MRIVVLLSALLIATGCGDEVSPAPHPLTLAWSFADGRSCVEAGVPFVVVSPLTGDTLTSLDCHTGLGHQVPAGEFPPGRLLVEGVTLDGTPVYRASVEMPGEAATFTAVLRYVGGEP